VIPRQRSEGSWFKVNPGKKLLRPPSQPISQVRWCVPVILATWEAIGRRITDQAGAGKNARPSLKNN
jgi:hypothetical protein